MSALAFSCPATATMNVDLPPLIVKNSAPGTTTPSHQGATGKSNMKHHQRRFWLIFMCAIFCVGLTMCVYVIRVSPEFNQYRIVRTYQSEPELQLPRTILLWNDFFGDKRWKLPDDTLGPAHFRDDLKCPVYRCELTNVHNFLPVVDMYDAVVFHTAQPFRLLNSVPAQRSPHQLYVFALMEPPGETKHILGDERNFYNLTMSYRLDSDIVWPYLHIVDRETGSVIAPATFPVWRQPPSEWNDTAIWQLWPEKLKEAAWFVSHCETLSQREKLAAELQKYMEVNIFGKCGPMSCQRLSQECDDMLDQKYKFYFSFENSLCTDYISEKLTYALQRNVIPVVFGGANYSRFLPPHSYINAESFKSVKALAAHLQHLSKHPEQYMRYFWWRRYYRLEERSPFCDLCEKLHSATYQQKTQSYRDIEKWWLGGSCRFDAKLKF